MSREIKYVQCDYCGVFYPNITEHFCDAVPITMAPEPESSRYYAAKAADIVATAVLIIAGSVIVSFGLWFIVWIWRNIIG